MQFGSRQNRSTTHNLVSLMDFVYRSSDVSGSVCTVITTDFAKAFDAVDHTVAVQCLLDLGVRPGLIPWICSFMTDRQQKVRYQGHLSDWEYPTCGVAQGTVLGPIVFLALINSALQDGPHHWKYVDDMTMAQSWKPKVPCTLQQTLNGLDTWVNEHKMKLNPKKCKVVHVTFMREKPALPALSIDQNLLEVCDTVKVLGVTIQADLKWDSQVDYMLTSANRKLFVLCRLKKFGVQDTELVPIYTGYVRPVLEYAVPVWHSSLTANQTKRLERVQKRACKIILGRRYSGYTEALRTLTLCTLAERRTQLCLDFARKLFKSNFRNWLPPLRKEISGRQTRNGDDLDTPTCKTERYKKSPIPYMCRLLNDNGF